MYIRPLLLLYAIYETKKRNRKITCVYQRKTKDLENKTGILYNDTVDQLKGM